MASDAGFPPEVAAADDVQAAPPTVDPPETELPAVTDGADDDTDLSGDDEPDDPQAPDSVRAVRAVLRAFAIRVGHDSDSLRAGISRFQAAVLHMPPDAQTGIWDKDTGFGAFNVILDDEAKRALIVTANRTQDWFVMAGPAKAVPTIKMPPYGPTDPPRPGTYHDAVQGVLKAFGIKATNDRDGVRQLQHLCNQRNPGQRIDENGEFDYQTFRMLHQELRSAAPFKGDAQAMGAALGAARKFFRFIDPTDPKYMIVADAAGNEPVRPTKKRVTQQLLQKYGISAKNDDDGIRQLQQRFNERNPENQLMETGKFDFETYRALVVDSVFHFTLSGPDKSEVIVVEAARQVYGYHGGGDNDYFDL